MGSQWFDDDQHERKGQLPKVLMVGELEVAIVDRKMTIDLLGDQILLRFPDYASVRAVMKQPFPSLGLAGKLLSFSQIGLQVEVGKRKPIELFPRPSWITKLLSSDVREMLDTASNS